MKYICPVCKHECIPTWGNKDRLTCLYCRSSYDTTVLREYGYYSDEIDEIKVFTTYTEEGD
jgi:hypothetical protein